MQFNCKKVDQDVNWYENFHVNRDKGVILADGRYRCDECKRNLPCADKRQVVLKEPNVSQFTSLHIID